MGGGEMPSSADTWVLRGGRGGGAAFPPVDPDDSLSGRGGGGIADMEGLMPIIRTRSLAWQGLTSAGRE